MIFSSLDCNLELPKYPAIINEALEYLKSNDFNKMEAGTYELKGKDLYVMVIDLDTGEIDSVRPETHENYLDIQFLVSGSERIGVINNDGSFKVEEAIKERDVIFYKDVVGETFIEMKPNCFCVLYPSDIHRPGVCCGDIEPIRKVVVKININLL